MEDEILKKYSKEQLLELMDYMQKKNITPNELIENDDLKRKGKKGVNATRALTEEEYRDIISLLLTGGFKYKIIDVVTKKGISKKALVERTFKPMPKIALALEVQANLGLRIGDVLSLTPNSIKDGKLQLKETKTKKLQNRPISKEIYLLIREYIYENSIEKDERIFNFTKRYVSKYLKIVADHLGLSNIGTHSFRKFYATHIYYKSGKDIGLVRDLLNHSSVAITENYININKEKVDEVSASMNLIVEV